MLIYILEYICIFVVTSKTFERSLKPPNTELHLYFIFKVEFIPKHLSGIGGRHTHLPPPKSEVQTSDPIFYGKIGSCPAVYIANS